MLKSKAKRLAVASVLSIAALVSIPLNALATGVVANNITELQAAIYKDMTERDTEFSITYKGPSINATIGDDVQTAIKAVKKNDDYLNWSWTSIATSMNGSQDNINFKVGYLITAEQEAVVDVKVSQALNSIITQEMTDFQKEKAINKWICDTVSFDYTLKNHSAYDAVVSPNKTVCQGYALLAFKMLKQEGIPAKIINGTIRGIAHAWIMVQIGENWYHLDVTGNDTNNNIYYNVTDSVLTQSGFVWDKNAFPSATTTYAEG